LFARFPGKLKLATEVWLALDPLTNPAAPGQPFRHARVQAAGRGRAGSAAEASQRFVRRGAGGSQSPGPLYADDRPVCDGSGLCQHLRPVLWPWPALRLDLLGGIILVVGVAVVATFPVIPLWGDRRGGAGRRVARARPPCG
jgi:hypothetical protein